MNKHCKGGYFYKHLQGCDGPQGSLCGLRCPLLGGVTAYLCSRNTGYFQPLTKQPVSFYIFFIQKMFSDVESTMKGGYGQIQLGAEGGHSD